MAHQRAVHRIGLPLQPGLIHACPAPHPYCAGAAIERGVYGRGDGRVADPHLADAEQVHVARNRLHTVGDGGGAGALVHGGDDCEIARRNIEGQFEHPQIDLVQRADL